MRNDSAYVVHTFSVSGRYGRSRTADILLTYHRWTFDFHIIGCHAVALLPLRNTIILGCLFSPCLLHAAHIALIRLIHFFGHIPALFADLLYIY